MSESIRIRNRVMVYKPSELKRNPLNLKEGTWKHALVEVDGGIFVCEVYHDGGFCHAPCDIVSKEEYDIS